MSWPWRVSRSIMHLWRKGKRCTASTHSFLRYHLFTSSRAHSPQGYKLQSPWSPLCSSLICNRCSFKSINQLFFAILWTGWSCWPRRLQNWDTHASTSMRRCFNHTGIECFMILEMAHVETLCHQVRLVFIRSVQSLFLRTVGRQWIETWDWFELQIFSRGGSTFKLWTWS